MWNTKVKLIEIKNYQLKKIFRSQETLKSSHLKNAFFSSLYIVETYIRNTYTKF